MAQTLSSEEILAAYSSAEATASPAAPARKGGNKPSLHGETPHCTATSELCAVTQLPYTCDKDEVRALFEKAGCSVKGCRLVIKNGKFTGVGFVDVEDTKSMELGQGLHRSAFKGRKINVRPTVSPQELARIAEATEQKSLERRVCFAYRKGNCKRGSSCMFLHEGYSQQPADSELPHKRQKKSHQPKEAIHQKPEVRNKPGSAKDNGGSDQGGSDEDLPNDEYSALFKQFRDSTKELEAFANKKQKLKKANGNKSKVKSKKKIK